MAGEAGRAARGRQGREEAREREGEAMVRGKRRYDIPSGKEVVAILESEGGKKR